MKFEPLPSFRLLFYSLLYSCYVLDVFLISVSKELSLAVQGCQISSTAVNP